MMPWFKFYSEFRYDTKLRRMPIPHRYAFVVLLCLANESNNRGTITGLDDDDLAFELEMELEDWRTLKAKFRVKGLIDIDGDGSIIITNWKKRQYCKPSDTPEATRERKRKQRAKAKALASGEVTPMSRDVTRCHATDKDLDIDLDQELEEIKNKKEENSFVFSGLDGDDSEPIAPPLSFSDSEGGTSEEGYFTPEPFPEIPHTSQSNVSAAPVDKVSQQPQWHLPPNPDDRFLQRVPEWRVSNRTNAYQEWIIEYVRLVVLPKTSPVAPMGDDGKHTVGQAINWLSNCELKGDLGCGKIAGYLEDAKAWWQKQAGKPQQTQTNITPEQVDRWLLAQAAKGDPVTVVNNLFDNPLDWTVRFGKRGGFTAKLRDVFDSSCLEIGRNT